MEPERENHNEPLSKRLRLDSDRQDAATTSQLSKERSEKGDEETNSSNASSPENRQGGSVDHGSDASNDFDNLSGMSPLSELDDQYDESSWQPVAGPLNWAQRQMMLGVNPRTVLKTVLGEEFEVADDVDEFKLWSAIINIVMEPRPRKKLPDFNTLDDVVSLLRKSKKIVVLTGAGVSVSCGIPDFRSRDGIYARLSKDFPNLPDPQAMFDIDFFKSDQRPFFKFAKEIYPGQFEPSRCHKFIKLLESHGKLLRNYSQNIDTLENVAGIERVIECHGSFATATCQVCGHNVKAEAIREEIFKQEIPCCRVCGPDVEKAVMKPDIVFFGESLPQKFHKQMASDKHDCDLLIVIGSSLKVRPVALIPSAIAPNVPQIIINREPLKECRHFDVELLGNCDDIVSELCKRLGEGWDHLAQAGPPAQEVDSSALPPWRTPPLPDMSNPRRTSGAEVVDHNADSGLGDSEGGGAREPKAASSLTPIPESQTKEPQSSSDSGAESATTPEVHGHIDLAVGAGSPSPDSSVAVSSQDACSSGQGDSNGQCRQSCAETAEEGCESSKGGCACGKEQPGSQVPGSAGSAGDASESCQELSCHQSSSASRKRKRSKSETCHSSEGHSSCNGRSPRKRTHSHSNGDAEKIDVEKAAKKDNTHCSHTDTIEQIRQMWVPHRRLSLSSRITDNQILFVAPNRYIFRGAEVYSSSEAEDSSDNESAASSPSSTGSPTRDNDVDRSADTDEQDDKMNDTAHSTLSLSSNPSLDMEKETKVKLDQTAEEMDHDSPSQSSNPNQDVEKESKVKLDQEAGEMDHGSPSRSSDPTDIDGKESKDKMAKTSVSKKASGPTSDDAKESPLCSKEDTVRDPVK